LIRGFRHMPRSQRTIALDESWLDQLRVEFKADYMQQLKAFLLQRKQAKAVIYPPGSEIFAALNTTPFDQVKIVVLGQDPYHGPGQAHGLCFSVKPGVRTPPSLLNIYKELNTDVGFDIPQHGYLMPWAQQGVLLLNAVLTVEQGRAGAHQNKGWEKFTDAVIQRLNAKRDGLVFLLWGSYAQKKAAFVDSQKHLVLKSVHPSPLSAHRGFFGSRHFSQANAYLQANGQSQIDWQLPKQA